MSHTGVNKLPRKLIDVFHALLLVLVHLLGSTMFSDIAPRATGEIIFTLVLQMIGAIVFGMIIGTVGTLLMSSKLLEEKVDRQLAELREFMHEKDIPKPLRKRIRDYMEHLYKAKTGYDVSEVLDQLPPKLSEELLNSMYRETIVRVPLFQNLDEGAVAAICLAMRPYVVMHGEYIFRENQLGKEMYVVEEGKVQMSRYGLVIGVLGKHSFLGEAALQPGRRIRDRSAYALVDSTLGLLTKADVEGISKDYPDLIKSFAHVAARKTKVEAIRMNKMLRDAAQELGVEVESKAMSHLLETVGQLTTHVDDMEARAILLVQNYVRRWLARKKDLTQALIQAGTLNTSTSEISQTLPHTKVLALDAGIRPGGLAPVTSPLGKTQVVCSASTTSTAKATIDQTDEQHEQAVARIAAKLAKDIRNSRDESDLTAGEDRMVAELDLDGDGQTDVVGYDTTGDGMIDALDTDLDGRVDEQLVGKGIASIVGGQQARAAGRNSDSTDAQLGLEGIQDLLRQVVAHQKALGVKCEEIQRHQSEEIQKLEAQFNSQIRDLKGLIQK
eukprot:COSAG02_NODE_2543_length_8570_cov_24.762956_11_plen_556_part_00